MRYTRFYGNLYECPHGNRLISCPVFNKDHLSFEEKFIWFDGLTPVEKEDIMNRHRECMEERSNKVAKK